MYRKKLLSHVQLLKHVNLKNRNFQNFHKQPTLTCMVVHVQQWWWVTYPKAFKKLKRKKAQRMLKRAIFFKFSISAFSLAFDIRHKKQSFQYLSSFGMELLFFIRPEIEWYSVYFFNLPWRISCLETEQHKRNIRRFGVRSMPLRPSFACRIDVKVNSHYSERCQSKSRIWKGDSPWNTLVTVRNISQNENPKNNDRLDFGMNIDWAMNTTKILLSARIFIDEGNYNKKNTVRCGCVSKFAVTSANQLIHSLSMNQCLFKTYTSVWIMTRIYIYN